MACLHAIASAVPSDTTAARTARIEKLRALVDSGTYRVDLELLAACLVAGGLFVRRT